MIKKYLKRNFPGLVKLNRYRAARQFLNHHPFPDLANNEKKDIDDYWKQFGIKFPDYTWFRMYYGVTGIHDPRFIPDPVAHYILYPHYNFRSHISGWDDKNVYERLVPNASFPYSLCHCIQGKLFDHDYRLGGANLKMAEKIIEQLDGETDIVFKAACGGYQGKSVKLLHVSQPQDILDMINAKQISNYILQKRVIQHPFFNQLSSSSNIIRVISWRDEKDIHVLSCTIRYGVEGSFTDISFVNGKETVNVVGIDKQGRIKERHYTNDGLKTESPTIVSKDVPSFDKLIDNVKKAHTDLVFFDFVAWDYMIDKYGNPICIEYNVLGPGTKLYQFANGPLAGEHTDSFLCFLKYGKSHIPWLYRV